MKLLLQLSAAISFPLLLVSCGGNDMPADQEASSGDSLPVKSEAFDYDTLKGLYKGDFGDSPISVNLSFVTEKHATGFNIVRGKRRNISGTVSREGEKITLRLSEPGDDKTDGIFTLFMSTGDPSKMTGEWLSQTGEVKNVSVDRLLEDAAKFNGFGYYTVHFNDSLGDLLFEPEGACVYEFYQNQGEPAEQLVQVKGSWKKTGEQIAVFWQANSVFPGRKSIFAVIQGPGEEKDVYYPKTLRGENREFSEIMY